MRGFFGKIPGHGDFVDRGLSAGFKARWDEWLQQGLASSKAVIGQDWLNIYLTSPVWRFVLGEGVCGSKGWAGVMVPSVDRVGRYFPLTIAAATEPGVVPLQVVTAASEWFEEIENIALEALDDDAVDSAMLARRIEEVGAVPLGPAALAAQAGGRADGAAAALAMPLAYGTSPGQGLLVLCHRLLEVRFGPAYSVWWTSGSDLVHAGLLACANLPAPESYAALLTDDCSPPGWQRLPGYGPGAESSSPVDAPEALDQRSAGAAAAPEAAPAPEEADDPGPPAGGDVADRVSSDSILADLDSLDSSKDEDDGR